MPMNKWMQPVPEDLKKMSMSKWCERVLIQIELLIENKLIICALGNLHYKISREKFEPEPGFGQ